MLEFLKPLAALAIVATLAGFAVVLDGLSRRGGATESRVREEKAVSALCLDLSLTMQEKDTVLDSSGTPHQIFRLQDSAGTAGYIVSFRAPHGVDTALYYVAARRDLVAVSAVPVSESTASGTLFRAAFAAGASGNFSRFRAEMNGKPLAPSPDIAARAAAILPLAAVKRKGGSHAHR